MTFKKTLFRSMVLALTLALASPFVVIQAQAQTATNSQNLLVASVLFEGNVRFSDANLLAMVDMASQGVFSKERLAVDTRSIALTYEEAGYKDAIITSRTEIMDNGRVLVVFLIDEGDRSGIAAINFSGNNSIGANQLKDAILTKETNLLSWLTKDDSYDEDRLVVDSELIKRYYANRGYPDAQVLSAIAEFDVTRNAYFINFTISEGEYYEFGGIAIETSIAGLDTEALKRSINTYEGNRYSLAKLQKTAQEMAYQATAQGYAFADVRPRIDRDVATRSFSVTYLVDEGARVYVERINIYGNKKTRDFVIRRELGFSEGDPFNRSLVTRGKAGIESLDFFSVVNVTSARGSAPDKIIINIEVEEKSTGDYGFTFGYSSADGVLGEVSLDERNFLGRGQYLRVSVGASQSGQTYNFSFTEPRFMGLKISAGIDLYKRVTEETTTGFYGSDATGGKFRIGMPVTDEVSTSLFVGFEAKTFRDVVAPLSDPGVISNGVTRSKVFVGYTLTYDGLDDRSRPTSGLFATFSQEYVGFDNSYIKSDAKARYFLPFLEDTGLVASIRGQAGVISDLSGSGVHPTETYVLGPQLVRGFTGGGMGPRLASGQALGATWYAGLSAELEFPIPVLPESYGLKGALWADMGYVGPESLGGPVATAGTTQPLRSSVGASIIWDSPFGPLRGDFAHVLQQDTADTTQVFQLTMRSLL